MNHASHWTLFYLTLLEKKHKQARLVADASYIADWMNPDNLPDVIEVDGEPIPLLLTQDYGFNLLWHNERRSLGAWVLHFFPRLPETFMCMQENPHVREVFHAALNRSNVEATCEADRIKAAVAGFWGHVHADLRSHGKFGDVRPGFYPFKHRSNSDGISIIPPIGHAQKFGAPDEINKVWEWEDQKVYNQDAWLDWLWELSFMLDPTTDGHEELTAWKLIKQNGSEEEVGRDATNAIFELRKGPTFRPPEVKESWTREEWEASDLRIHQIAAFKVFAHIYNHIASNMELK